MGAVHPPLGPVQRPVLEALAGAPDGLTVTDLAAAAGIDRGAADQSVRILRDRGMVRVAAYERRKGKTASVYVATTAGRAALEAARETT